MTQYQRREGSWSAQEPSVGFAERTVQRILNERLQNSAIERRVPSRVRWRKPGFLLVAAALVSASAWGAVQASRYLARSEPSKPAVVVHAVPAAPAPKVITKAVEPPPAVVAVPAAQPSAKPTRARPAVPVPSASAETAPRVLPKPRVPPCWCDPDAVLCGCAE